MIGLFKQFIKFGFVGALNTIISLTIYYLFIWIDDGYYIIGNVIGFIVSTLNAYLLNSKFVFSKKTKQNTWQCSIILFFNSFILKEFLLHAGVTYGGR